MTGFKAGMMSGYDPGKFLDMVGDAQKLLKDSKGNTYVKQWTEKGWRYIGEQESLTEKDLLEKAIPLFNDPKYQTQLQKLQYYNLRGYGGNTDPKAAVLKYNSEYAGALDKEISSMVSKLSEEQKLAISEPKARHRAY